MAVSSLSEGVAESVGASLGALAALGARGPAFSGLWPSLLPARAGLLLALDSVPGAALPRHFGTASGLRASGTARLPLAVGVGRSLQPHWASSIAFLAALWASLSAASWSLAATRSRHAWVAASGWIRRSRSTMVGRPGSSETSRRAGKAEASAISLLVRGEGCSVAVVVVFTRSTALSDSKADFSIGLRPFVSA